MCKHMFSQPSWLTITIWTGLHFHFCPHKHTHSRLHSHANLWTVNNKIKVIVWLKHFTMHDSSDFQNNLNLYNQVWTLHNHLMPQNKGKKIEVIVYIYLVL